MPELSSGRDQQFGHMRETAREIFTTALKNASIESAFARNVHCERRLLRIGEDLHDLDSYDRLFVVSIGKAAHTMAAALEARFGSTLEGIVASSVEPAHQIRGFRYFHGGHPIPQAASVAPRQPIPHNRFRYLFPMFPTTHLTRSPPGRRCPIPPPSSTVTASPPNTI